MIDLLISQLSQQVVVVDAFRLSLFENTQMDEFLFPLLAYHPHYLLLNQSKHYDLIHILTLLLMQGSTLHAVPSEEEV